MTGRRIKVALPDYSGEAGFVERGGGASLSHIVSSKPKNLLHVQVEVDGRSWIVEQSSYSQYIDSYRVLVLRAAG